MSAIMFIGRHNRRSYKSHAAPRNIPLHLFQGYFNLLTGAYSPVDCADTDTSVRVWTLRIIHQGFERT